MYFIRSLLPWHHHNSPDLWGVAEVGLDEAGVTSYGSVLPTLCVGGHFYLLTWQPAWLNVWDFTFKFVQLFTAKKQTLMCDGCVYCCMQLNKIQTLMFDGCVYCCMQLNKNQTLMFDGCVYCCI